MTVSRSESIRKWVVDLSTVAVAVAAIVLVAVRVSGRSVTSPSTGDLVETIEGDWRALAEGGHRVGPNDALVTVVEFGDYQCPVCRGFEPYMEALRLQYQDEDVAFIYRHYPLANHALAYPAARAAVCADKQGAFRGVHQRLYGSEEWFLDPKQTFIRFAREAGVEDLPAFEACVSATEPEAVIEADRAAAQSVGGRGTPTLLINDVMVHGARSGEELASMIDEALLSEAAAR